MVSFEVSSATAPFDCAGSQRVPFATTVPHGLVAAGFLVVFWVPVRFLEQNVVLRDRRRRSDGFGGSKRGLRGKCKENRGRRSILWTLPKRLQACVIRRIAFYVAGAGNPRHGCYVLRSKEKGCIFGT